MILENIAELLAEIIDCDENDITSETVLTAECGVEKLDLVRLVMECEKEFKITIHDEDVFLFRTVGDIVDYIKMSKE